jgi:hypothetical protein
MYLKILFYIRSLSHSHKMSNLSTKSYLLGQLLMKHEDVSEFDPLHDFPPRAGSSRTSLLHKILIKM